MSRSSSINLSGSEAGAEARPSSIPQLHREHSAFTRNVRSRGNSVLNANELPANPFRGESYDAPTHTSSASSRRLPSEVFSDADHTLQTKPTTSGPSSKGKQRRKESVQSIRAVAGSQAAAGGESASDSDQPSLHLIHQTGSGFGPSPRPLKKYRANVYHGDVQSRRKGLGEKHYCVCSQRNPPPTAPVDLELAESSTVAATLVNAPKMSAKILCLLAGLFLLSITILALSACGIALTHGEHHRVAKGIYLAAVVIIAAIASVVAGCVSRTFSNCSTSFIAVIALGIFFRQELDTYMGVAVH